MRGLKSALVAVSALLIGGGVALAQSRFDELQRTYDESDRTLECCSQRWAQLDYSIHDDSVASQDGTEEEGE